MSEQDLPQHPLIVIGGSTGGIEAVIQLLQHLPVQFPAPIFIVIHIQAQQSIALPQLLHRCTGKTTCDAIDRATIEVGYVYTALPDRHLLLTPEGMHVVMGAKEHGFRPAIDPLFRTAARHYGNRVIGIILSGALWDGTAGLAEIKARGVTIVQDPQQALVPSMPQSAINYGVVDYVLPIAEIAQLLVALIQPSDCSSGDIV